MVKGEVKPESRLSMTIKFINMRTTIIAVSILLIPIVSKAQLLSKDFTSGEKILGLSRFWSEAKYSFANFRNVSGLNWDSAYQAFIPKVLNTKTGYEYGRMLEQFCALLKDGHSGILYGFGFYYDTLCTPPVHIQNFDHKAYVTWVPDTLKSRIPIGSEIISVDNKPTALFIREDVIPYIPESTDESRWNSSIVKMLEGISGTQVTFQIKTPKGEMKNMALVRNYKLNRIRELEANDPPIQFKWFENRVAYVNIITFSSEKLVSLFDSILPELYKAKAVIIDIRSNTGGNDLYAVEIVKHFTTADTIEGNAVSTRQHIGAYKAWGRSNNKYNDYRNDNAFFYFENSIYRNKSGKKITVPLVVLTGTRTRSASEDFLVMLKQLKRATIIGEPTGGTTGQPLFFKLVGQLSGAICSIKNTFPNGEEFVGKGIMPDILIRNTIADLLEGKDRVIEYACNYLMPKK